MIFDNCRVTLIRDREAEVRDPETDELIETFTVPDDLVLSDQATFTFYIDPYEYEDDE